MFLTWAWLSVDQNGGSVANSRLPRTTAGVRQLEIQPALDSGIIFCASLLYFSGGGLSG
jgi:hypothetical protein